MHRRARRHVEVDRSLLEHFNAHLAAVVRNTPPSVNKDGVPYWRPSMTRPMLLTLVNSLTLGELVLSKGVTVGEALATFARECINWAGQPLARASSYRPRASRTPSTSRRAACSWSRSCARAWRTRSCGGRGAETILDTATRSNAQYFSATSTRLWVRFADRPKQLEAASLGYVEHLCHKMPRWFGEPRGGRRCTTASRSRTPSSASDHAAFKLTAEIEADPLGCFSVRNDCHKKTASGRTRELARGEVLR